MQIDHPSVLWLIVAIICAVAEIILASFGAIFGSVAALIVALIAISPSVSIQAQVIIFAISLLLSLYFIRPRIMAKMKESKGVPDLTDALIGKYGVITVALDPISGMGRALVEGNDWAVKGESGLAENTKVMVVGANGIVLTVKQQG